jgi:hypothetical protein
MCRSCVDRRKRGAKIDRGHVMIAGRMAFRTRLVLLAALWLVATAVIAGCGGGSDAADQAAAEAGPEHVHGLGVNSADGALYVATHTGLFRMERNSDEMARVGDRLQDTMGFAVVGPDRFVGSGHPDLRDDLPPLLGLIASDDAGSSWETVSLTGEADFHALLADGERIIGYDSSGDRVMASRDGGATWRETPAPAAIADIAADPAASARLLATSEAGVLASRDSGASWRVVGGDAVLLAWPTRDALYGFTSFGDVRLSRDGGRTWSDRGKLPGAPAAVTEDGDRLIVALHDGGFASSADGGRTWQDGAWG